MQSWTSLPADHLRTLAGASPAEWAAALREQQWARNDRLWLTVIVLERFITRLFSDKLGWLPGWVNFLDYPILVLFAVYVAYTVRKRSISRAKTGFGGLTLALGFVIAVSAVANLGRLHPGAVALFVTGLLEPLAFMGLAFVLHPRREDVAYFVKLLLFVGWCQVAVVAFLDLPVFFATRNPDFISGTFGENPYQMTFFLLSFNFIIVAQLTQIRQRARTLRILGIVFVQIIIFAIILLAQFRTLLPSVILTWIFSYFVLNVNSLKRWVAVLASLIMLVYLFFTVAYIFPELKWIDIVQLASRSEEALQSGKVQAVENLGHMFADEPRALLIGTGPATYASRGFQTFSIIGDDTFANRAYQRLFDTPLYMTDVAARYTMPVIDQFSFGAATTATPWFSFLALPAEIGILGLCLVLAIYGRAIWICWTICKRGTQDLQVLAGWVLISLLVLLQMAFIENWLEASRLTVPVWLLFGLVLAHRNQGELPARPAA